VPLHHPVGLAYYDLSGRTGTICRDVVLYDDGAGIAVVADVGRDAAGVEETAPHARVHLHQSVRRSGAAHRRELPRMAKPTYVRDERPVAIKTLTQILFEAVDAYVTARDEALANNLPAVPFPPGQAFDARAGAVWRVRAEAFGADGVTFVRESVVRATADPRRPYYALLWSEGERPPPPPAVAPEADPSSRVPANDAPRS